MGECNHGNKDYQMCKSDSETNKRRPRWVTHRAAESESKTGSQETEQKLKQLLSMKKNLDVTSSYLHCVQVFSHIELQNRRVD